MKLNIIKKIVCKHCGATSNLNEIQHPAKWTYTLCDDCVEVEEKGFKIKKVSIEGNTMAVDLVIRPNQGQG